MKILYVHDLFDQTEDVTYQALKNHFVNDEINAILFTYDKPNEAIKLIEEATKTHDLLIATGLGCYLSLGFKSISKIFINFLYPNDVKDYFVDKDNIYQELIDCGVQRDPLDDYRQQIYNQDNTYYLFGIEDEIKNNIGEVDCEIQFENAGYMYLDGSSPFSGIGVRYYSKEDPNVKFYSIENVYEVYSTKHRIDTSSTNCFEAIDECISRLKNRN